jgi:hypothetical protein
MFFSEVQSILYNSTVNEYFIQSKCLEIQANEMQDFWTSFRDDSFKGKS